MASALQNPNDHRRINKIAREHVNSGTPVKILVDEWLTSRHLPKHSRPEWMQRNKQFAARIKAATAAGNTDAAFAGLKQTSDDKRDALARARTKVRREFAKAEGYGPGYPGRAGRTHAGRYLSKQKKTNKRKTRSGKTLRGVRVSRKGIKKWNQTRQGRRASGDWGKTIPWGTTTFRMENPFAERYPGAVARAEKSILVPSGKRRARKPRPGAEQLDMHLATMRSNPSLIPLGDLALTNPRVMGAGNYFMGYALPVTVAGAAAGGIHAIASTSGLTAKLGELVDKVPAVGPAVAENLPYTLQGLVVGSGLALLAPMVGGAAGRYLALAGGAALVVGGGIDTFNYALGTTEKAQDAVFEDELEADLAAELDNLEDVLAEEDLSGLALAGLALDNMGGLALDNMGDLAFTNGLGDLGGMAYETAPLTAAPASEEYGQASLADAHYSGADFSPEEGQALMNGRDSFLRRFGAPPVRMAGRQVGPSHLAGRTGHRWGWLVRMLGWHRAQQIASLPPKRRVQFIKKLRQAAIASFQQLKQEAQALAAEQTSHDPEFVPAAGTAVNGAQGATNYLGEPALFMGA